MLGMDIDLRGKRPVVDFDKVNAGDVLPVTVRGVDVADGDDVEVTIETPVPLRIGSGKVRITAVGESTRWIDADDLTPYVLGLALNEALTDVTTEVKSDSVVLYFDTNIQDGDAPVLEHSGLGELPDFVTRKGQRVFVIRLEVVTLALEGTFLELDAAEFTMTEIELGGVADRGEYALALSDYPDFGFFRIKSGNSITDQLYWQASAWEISRALKAASITGFSVYATTANPPEFRILADAVGVIPALTVESFLFGPNGFEATLDLSELSLRAGLAGVRSMTCNFVVRVNGLTVFSDLFPLSRLIRGGSIAGD
jgi:hypothetical protein